jgi:tetratricopeptide (TPR) repeat protein
MPESPEPRPHNSHALAEQQYLRGVEKLAENNPEEALVAFEQALQCDETMLEALHGVVRALRDCGRLDDAIEAAKRLTALEPDEALPHTSLSILYQQKGMIPEAEEEATCARLLDWKRELKNPPPSDSQF